MDGQGGQFYVATVRSPDMWGTALDGKNIQTRRALDGNKHSDVLVQTFPGDVGDVLNTYI